MISISITAANLDEADDVLQALHQGKLGPTLVFDVDTESEENEVTYDVRVFLGEIEIMELAQAIRWGCIYITEDDLLDMVFDHWTIDRIQTTIFQRMREMRHG
jgi:hypothetical protein